MQENKKKIVCDALAKTVKKLRGDKSRYMHCAEYGISTSILSNIERALKDPQLTTLMKLAESFGLKFSEFAKLLENELPDNFSFYDD